MASAGMAYLCSSYPHDFSGGLDSKASAYNAGDQVQSPEKAMAPHSSVLAWRIPGAVEPGGLPSMGSHRVGHD